MSAFFPWEYKGVHCLQSNHTCLPSVIIIYSLILVLHSHPSTPHSCPFCYGVLRGLNCIVKILLSGCPLQSQMTKMKAMLAANPDSYLHVILWAVCCMGFFGFLRCGEFLISDQESFVPSKHLSLADIWLDRSVPQWCVHVRIKRSKTDQFSKRATAILGSFCHVETVSRT